MRAQSVAVAVSSSHIADDVDAAIANPLPSLHLADDSFVRESSGVIDNNHSATQRDSVDRSSRGISTDQVGVAMASSFPHANLEGQDVSIVNIPLIVF